MEKVLTAMSGGVDSTVAALLLKDNYDVSGGTLLLHDLPTARTAVRDAARAAEGLSVPHFVFDRREVFKKRVMDAFARSYIKGRTPNPCAICNRTVKFPELLMAASKLGIGKLATGHYARIDYDPSEERWRLKKGLDGVKDQSYFLYGLSQETLARTLFPLGELTKARVKELARERGLVTAVRPESQDVCFVPDDYRAFLTENGYVKPVAGDFTDENGRVLGRHEGSPFYTVGQRRGLGVSASERLYVLAIDPGENRVVLGPEERLTTSRVTVERINWVSVAGRTGDFPALVKLRYSRTEQEALVHMTGYDSAVVELKTAQRRPAAGQCAVFYDGDTVIGGGIVA